MQLSTSYLDKLEKQAETVLARCKQEMQKHAKLLDDITATRQTLKQIVTALNGTPKPKVVVVDSLGGLNKEWNAVLKRQYTKPLNGHTKYAKCSACLHYKLRTSFYKCTSAKSGIQSWCKKCIRAYLMDKRAKGR